METYFGYIETVQDALLIFESCRIGALPRVHRRLNERERRWLRSGSVYVWDEEESDVRRWTDGRLWSPSRIRGRFLVYRELSCRRTEAMDVDSPEDPLSDAVMSGTGGSHAYGGRGHSYSNSNGSIVPNGLIKRTIAVETSSGRRLHLISYFSEADLASGALPRPRFDPRLQHVQIPREIYPE
ncbi:gluconate transport inducer 1/Pac2, partial [Syncephalis pseudoplumigaleata]